MLGIASLILVVFVGLSYHQWEQYRRASLETERSREILTAIDSVLVDLADAETGQRGFLLTDEDRYLEPYRRATQALPKDLATLGKLLNEGHRNRHDFDELNSLANQELQEFRQTIELRREKGAKAALAVLLTDEGKRTMDSIRAICARMQRSEDANQAQSSTSGEAASEVALLVTAIGALLLLFIFAVGFEPFASPEPLAWQRSRLLRYGAAVLGVIAITLIRAALTPVMGPTEMPFTLYFCAVAFAAWFGGFRPTLLSIVLSLLAGSWFFATPTRSLWVGRHDDQVAMLMIVLVGFGLGLLSRAQRNAVDRAVRAETSERDERQRFETTLSSIGDAVIATDAEGRVTFINRVASALLKWTEAEAEGRSLDEVFRIVHEVTRAPVDSPVARVLREGRIVGLANHTILIARDETEVPIDDSAAPIRDSEGRMRGTVLVFRDVTERRRTEKQLAEQALLLEQAAAEARSQRQRLGLALTAGKMGVFEVDPVGKDLWWSPETYSLFGVSPAEFKPARDSFAELIHPSDRELFMQHWDENIAGHQAIKHEFRILQPDGKERCISCRGTPKNDDSGLPVHYSGIFLDITERKEAEQVLRKFEKLSAAARLSTAIAHEINNPLSAVTNLIYLAKVDPAVPPSVAEHLSLAERELERVAIAARQALGFYRESSRAERFDVQELIESVLGIFSTRIAEKKVRIVRDFPGSAPVYGVRGEIRQVVSNLLANALEAVKEGGTISLGTHTDQQGAIEIVVADDGHGIAPEHRDRIFEPFFTTKAGTGTGLGLWVAKEIITRHEGSIEVQLPDNGSGRCGATFRVRLPGGSEARLSNLSLDPRKSVEKVAQSLSEDSSAGKLG